VIKKGLGAIMTISKSTWIWYIAVLFLASCLSHTPFDSSLDDHINTYLVDEVGIAGFGGEIFCAFEYLDSDIDPAGTIYIWALCQEYNLMEDSLTEGSGLSLPVALETQMGNDQIEIIGHRVPGDGSHFGPDVHEIFPRGTWRQIMPKKEAELDQYNLRASELSTETLDKANEHFSRED
jgi:hypothetical protein